MKVMLIEEVEASYTPASMSVCNRRECMSD
jgi:hypothetical protein